MDMLLPVVISLLALCGAQDAPEKTTQFPPGYLEKTGNYIKQVIETNQQLGNQLASLVNSAAQAGTSLTNGAAQFGTNLGQTATNGFVQMGQSAVQKGSGLAKQSLDLASTFGKLFPSGLSHVVSGVTGLGHMAVDTAEKVSNWGLDKAGSIGNQGISMAGTIAEKGTGVISNTVQSGTDKVKEGIDTVANGIKGKIDSSIKAIEYLFPHFGKWTTK